MHGVFVLSGPGIEHKENVRELRAVDIAPTLSLLMGIPGPQNARGAILYDILKGGEGLQEVTIIDVSDWHAQLTPLAEAADNLAGQPDLLDGRRGVLQDVVRHLWRRGCAQRIQAQGPRRSWAAIRSVAQRLRSRTSSATNRPRRSWG